MTAWPLIERPLCDHLATNTNFTWTNDDQNSVALAIAKDGMSPEDAATQWIDANPDKVDAWLQGG